MAPAGRACHPLKTNPVKVLPRAAAHLVWRPLAALVQRHKQLAHVARPRALRHRFPGTQVLPAERPSGGRGPLDLQARPAPPGGCLSLGCQLPSPAQSSGAGQQPWRRGNQLSVPAERLGCSCQGGNGELGGPGLPGSETVPGPSRALGHPHTAPLSSRHGPPWPSGTHTAATCSDQRGVDQKALLACLNHRAAAGASTCPCQPVAKVSKTSLEPLLASWPCSRVALLCCAAS